MTFQIEDASLQRSVTLPNGANTTNSTAIDLKQGPTGSFVADTEVVINAPALTVGQLADTQTITYSLRHSPNADLSGDSELAASLILQTGAGGVGAVAAERRVRLPSNVQRYVFLRALKVGASNASTASGTMKMVF